MTSALLCAVLAGCEGKMSGQALEGVWQFDLDLNVQYVADHSQVTEKDLGIVRIMLSKIELGMEFTDGKWITRVGDVEEDAVGYEVVATGRDWIQIEITDVARKGVKPKFYFYEGALVLRKEGEAAAAAMVFSRV